MPKLVEVKEGDMTTFMRIIHAMLIILSGFVWLGAVAGFFLLRGVLSDSQATGETWIAAYFVASCFAMIFYSVGREWLGGKSG